MNEAPTHPNRGRPGRARLLVGGAVATALAAVFALVMTILPGSAVAATTICNSQTGNSGGMYYQMWTNGQGSACMTLNSSNSYSTSWSGVGDFVDGVGWNPGSNQTVSFSGNLSANGGTTLVSLYGWSTNPLVEYYVEEDYVGSPNTSGQYMGQMTSDGGTYNIYEHQQVNQPCITGNNCTFQQYLAIRTSPVSSGTITTQNFFNAWASHGMNLGTMNYQILATEAWGGGSGNDSFTVSHSNNPPSSAPPSSSPPSTNPPTSAAASTPPANGGCTATYAVTNPWPGGFQANVTVANNGSTALNGWTVHFTLASGQTITSLWSGVNSGTTGAVTVKNASYNGSVAPGASTAFGFTANGGSAPATNVSCSSP